MVEASGGEVQSSRIEHRISVAIVKRCDATDPSSMYGARVMTATRLSCGQAISRRYGRHHVVAPSRLLCGHVRFILSVEIFSWCCPRIFRCLEVQTLVITELEQNHTTVHLTRIDSDDPLILSAHIRSDTTLTESRLQSRAKVRL
jgi:hypothetical protein